MAKIAPKIRLTYNDGETVELYTGAFSQIAAKRKFGLEALKASDPEAIMYSCWIELHGVPKHADPKVVERQFDEFLKTVGDIDYLGDDEDDGEELDPTPAESSGSSLDSPPILVSTPSD